MQEAAALLQWYVEAGVDEFIEDEPQSRITAQRPVQAAPATGFSDAPAKTGSFDSQPIAKPLPQSTTPAAPYCATSSSPAEALAKAKDLAAQSTTLKSLEEAVHAFDGLSIKKTASNTVFADGNPESRLMLLGEAPGMEEDRRGIPFCGPSGKLLDKMMAAIGRDRNSFYISNTLFWRPPGNRQPSNEELEICRPFVEKHIALVNPHLLVLVGGTATKGVLQETRGITRLRKQRDLSYCCKHLEHNIPVIALYHPSYLLRQPAKKQEAWQDLMAIEEKISTFQAA